MSLVAWAELIECVNDRTSLGERGVRDPDYPCAEHSPTDNRDLLGLRITAPGDGPCDSDGHYLCVGCIRLSARSIDERTNGC